MSIQVAETVTFMSGAHHNAKPQSVVSNFYGEGSPLLAVRRSDRCAVIRSLTARGQVE
jgi:hypothetical protein